MDIGPVPLDKIPLHVSGGHILPLQQPDVNTLHSRKKPFELLIALDTNQAATGDLYYDDGDSLDTISYEKFFYANMTMGDNVFLMNMVKNGYTDMESLVLDRVIVLGLTMEVESVYVNNNYVENWAYNDGGLVINNINVKITELQSFMLF